MRERTELLIRGMTENRTKRHRWLAMVTALAFLTGGNVFWSLREIGTAVTEETLCTREAHEHSEGCYDENGDLICGKEEHVHTAACFSDENADVETAEIWEATIPEREGLSRQEQAALIAESQLGYAESMNNFILGEDGTQHGYTRYGAWYGNPYGEWNTMFTYFCLYYAGVSAEEIPCIGNARTWQVKLSECGLIRGPDTEPERGEVILLDLDADGEADLTGIVTDAAETLHFIEGDLGHVVAAGELAPDDGQILGYVTIPEPDTPAEEAEAVENPQETEEAPTEETAAEAAEDSGAESETEGNPEPHEPLVTYKAESESGILVSAAAAEGVFPADTVMTVSDVPREEALQAVAAGLSSDANSLEAIAVDISFYAADGTELEPTGDVDVEITLPETQRLEGDSFTLLHVADDGAVKTVESEIVGDAVVFTAESFSLYVLTSNVAVEKSNVIMINGEKGNNSPSNPFVIGVGETIEVWYDGTDYNACNFTVVNNDYNNVQRIARDTTNRTVGNHTYDGWDHKDYERITARWIGSTVSQDSDNCYIVLRKNGVDIETLYIKVVDHPVFIMNGDRRVLLEDNTIVRNVGDTFTLSLNGYNAASLLPKDAAHEDYNSAYDLSDFLYRGATRYTDGNTYVDFVCKKTARGDNAQTITINGRPITVTINNDYLYQVDGNTRSPINGGLTIYAAINETFTLSVNDKASHRLASQTHAGETNAYVIGECLKRGETQYDTITINGATVDTTNVTFTCLKEDETEFSANGQTIRVIISSEVAASGVYMLMNNGNHLTLEQALQELNNNKIVRKLYLIEGETCTLSLPGENQGSQFSVADSNILSMGTADNYDGYTDVTFTAEKHGTTTVTVNGVQIEVEVKHPMKVKDNLHERDIDRINEWVDTATGWLSKENGYIHNANNYYPYQLYDGDTLNLTVPVGNISGANLVISDTDVLSLTAGSLSTADSGGNLVITLTAHNDGETEKRATVQLKDSSGTVIRTMYVRIPKSNHELLDHADIEIADGGRYTVTKLTRDANGNVTKVITEYKAYVDGVNSSVLYQKDDDSTPCAFYYTSERFMDASGNYYDTVTRYTQNNETKYRADNNGTPVEVTKVTFITQYNDSGEMLVYDIHESAESNVVTVTSRTQSVRTGIVGYITENYGVDPNVMPGTPQYEFTSKYKIDQQGHYYDWSNIKYYASDVDHVVFDVKLALEPSSESVYVKDNNGEWHLQTTTSITATDENTKHLDSVRFSMNHQDVLDAYNKCPNHTGLDFTVMAFSALVELNLNKKLTGGTVTDKQFAFEIVQKEVQVARKFGNFDDSLSQTDCQAMADRGLKFKGAYRIFYDQDTKWGAGIDGEAALKELRSMPEFSSLNSAGDVFNIANNDNEENKTRQAAVLRVLQQYLATPAALTETDLAYTLQDDGFYLFCFESDPVDTAWNDADGVVTFNALHYEKGGEYEYIIREKIPENTNGITYDRRELDLIIRVDENAKILTADILSDVTQFEFDNELITYTLPSTGGAGTLPWYLGGTAILAAASLLLIQKRREGR